MCKQFFLTREGNALL